MERRETYVVLGTDGRDGLDRETGRDGLDGETGQNGFNGGQGA